MDRPRADLRDGSWVLVLDEEKGSQKASARTLCPAGLTGVHLVEVDLCPQS